MKKYFFIVLIGLIGSQSFAQQYDKAIGLRTGLFNGLTYKMSIAEDKYLEGLVSMRWKGVMATVLMEFSQPLNVNEPGFNWYYGAGAHMGFWNDDTTGPWDVGDLDDDYPIIGVDGIVGLEYTFAKTPINLSIDWKPTLNLIGNSSLWPDNIGLAIRYTF